VHLKPLLLVPAMRENLFSIPLWFPWWIPYVYSLRNKDVKGAMRKTLSRRKFCSEILSLCAYSYKESSLYLLQWLWGNIFFYCLLS
jgi:hypothetical protein